jgi:hypothetical protein
MFRPIAHATLLAAAFTLASGAAHAQTRVSHSSWESDGPVTSCDQIDVSFGEWEHVARAEQSLTIPGGTALVAHLTHANGVSVFRGSGANYTVHACKAAAADGDGGADARVNAISVTAQNGEISVKGPDAGNRWVAHLIIETPATVSLDLSTENGPLALRDISGKIRAHAQNGPVSLDHCSGDIEANTENGPLSFRGSGGRLNLRTDNGPLSIHLEGDHWSEGQLEGRTENGPVSVSVAHGYGSGVVVESDGYSPFSCASCENTQRTWDDRVRRVELGSHPVVVHLSTTNGPVAVSTSRN